MPKVRLLAPWTNKKGEPQASGAVIDVSDEEAQDLSGRGQASLVEEEEKLEKGQTPPSATQAQPGATGGQQQQQPGSQQQQRPGSQQQPQQQRDQDDPRKR